VQLSVLLFLPLQFAMYDVGPIGLRHTWKQLDAPMHVCGGGHLGAM
jgi:hypothetical protein